MTKRTWILVSILFAVGMILLPQATKAAEDNTAPQITAINISPDTFNTSDEDQALTLTLTITDDLAGVCINLISGYDCGTGPASHSSPIQLRLVPMLGTQYVDFYTFTRVSGDDKNGTYTAIATIPKYSKVGLWAPFELYLVDKLGNSSHLDLTHLQTQLPNSTMMVANTSDATQVTIEKEWVFSNATTHTTATFPANTVVTRSNGGSFAFYKMVNQWYNVNLLPDENLIGDPVWTIQLGVPGLGLTYSKNVTVSMRVDPMLAGQTLQIKSLEETGTSWANESSCTVVYHGKTTTYTMDDENGNPVSVIVDGHEVTVPDPEDTESYGTCTFTTNHASFFTATKAASIVVGAKTSSQPIVRTYGANGKLKTSFFAYASTFRKGVNVAVGDLDGDGTNEIITSPSVGGGPQIRIFDVDGVSKKLDFFAYDTKFRGGVNVAAGDVDGDGKDELITAPMGGGASQVRIFKLSNNSMGVTYPAFYAYNLNFRGGTSLAVGDLNGDGLGEIVTTPTSNGGPHVQVFVLRSGKFTPAYGGLMAYASTFRGGISASTGDVNGDGKDEIITAVVGNGGPHIRILGLNSANKLVLKYNGFMAYAPAFRGGVAITSADVNNDGKDEIITGVGSAGNPTIRMFSVNGLQVVNEFNAFATTYKGGVSLAAGLF